jgi:hypothetical protein
MTNDNRDSFNGGCAHPGDFKARARAALTALTARTEAGGRRRWRGGVPSVGAVAVITSGCCNHERRN